VKRTGRRVFAVIFLLALLGHVPMNAAQAEEGAFVTTGKIHESLPELTFTVADTGKKSEHPEREYVLEVRIESEDGSVSQTLEYFSGVTPLNEYIAPFVRLEDMNFDGFADMNLLTAQGARNVFTALSVFNPEKSAFEEVMQGQNFHQEEREFDDGWNQLELCNYERYPERLGVYSCVQDGFYYAWSVFYGWEGKYSLVPDSLEEIYDAGKGLIGERLELYGTGMIRCWDEHYPETWYYENAEIHNERRASLRRIVLGEGGTGEAEYRRVANVDWVNLRKMDSKESPSLARLDAGTEVQVLAEGIGTDEGWVRVWYMPDGHGIFLQEPDDGSKGLTGYIWHSFLEEIN